MSFHPIEKPRRRGPVASANSVSARIYQKYAHIAISGDLCAFLQIRHGDFARLLMGTGIDAGSFAIERSSDPSTYRVRQRPHSKVCAIAIRQDLFPFVKNGQTARFTIEQRDNLLICRPSEVASLQVVGA